MAIGSDILIVIATTVCVFSIASVVAGWAVRVWPVMALVSLAIGLGLFAFVHVSVDGGLALRDVPDAFILVAARILN
ncbi:hypothetical protein N8I71_06670 [Roseibacterium sp. SDUM158016]|jgi:hypothetical protein|uniref:hypothetical protein n=1 Tax=Roseicyclus sediminis TaxID=2980997 RepID=UPI0021CFA137|nr:hypothetical protein [Roseibacterium sp. SDUM158016]MCU4652508.1 hypothetical protein [Roseibacterium sp. SDUM158016]